MPFGAEPREKGIGLALSGGGFRAVLFHVGSIMRLNDARILERLNRISSVSGGSIAAGTLAVGWHKLAFDAGYCTNLTEVFTEPLRAFCGKTLDAWAIIGGAINPFRTAADEVMDEYRKRLGMHVMLTDLTAEGPRFVFNATNYATGGSFRFSREYCGDYRIGMIPRAKMKFDVALAVACSSAFPPVLSPIDVDVDPADFDHSPGADLFEQVGFRKRLLLADGGVYDNMGLETVWGRYENILVSDAGKPFEFDASVATAAPKQILRVMDIGLTQALALRRRMLILQFQQGHAKGAFWGINTPIQRYAEQGPWQVPAEKVQELSTMRTRLDKFNDQEQSELINWGYAVTDAALRTHANHLIEGSMPTELPCKAYPLG